MVCNDKWHSVVLFFILDEVFSVNTTCFVKTMVNARIAVATLFQMTFQFTKPFFGSLFIGADAFDSESFAVRNTFGAMFRMTTLWGQVLMFFCRLLYMSVEIPCCWQLETASFSSHIAVPMDYQVYLFSTTIVCASSHQEILR